MAELVFLLQTSNGVPVMGLARDGDVIFDSSKDEALLGSRDYRMVLETGLERIGEKLHDITGIFVDIGPGGLGVTRTGVAFANALGFALGLPTTGLPAFELLGRSAALSLEASDKDPIVILRKAARPYVHFGIFTDGVLAHYEHCTLDDAQKTIVSLDKYHLFGNVPLADCEDPASNVATLEAMLSCAVMSPKVSGDVRANPIVDAVF